MTTIGWCVVVLVLIVILVLIVSKLRSGVSNAMGYKGYGYCPNMGTCAGCNVCEED